MESNIKTFVTTVKVYLKKMTKVGIEIPLDIISYLVLFKFPSSIQNTKLQTMHSTTNMKIDIVLNHLIQDKNESISKGERVEPVNVALYRGLQCKNGKHNMAVTSHMASSCWFEFPELKPANPHNNQGPKKRKPKAKDKAHFYNFFCVLSSNVSQNQLKIHASYWTQAV